MHDPFRLPVESVMKAFGSARVFWLVVILALGCAFLLSSQKLQPADDAYITFRHVNNLLEHWRPAWNLHGEPVLGATTPAFLLALAGFCKVLGLDQIDQAALYLNAVFHFLIVILSYLVAKDLVGRVLPAVLTALLVGLNAVNVFVFSQGFESAMFVLALVTGLYFVRIGCDRLSLLLASVAPLIRPEGILLTPLVWGYILVTRRFKKKLLLTYLPIPILWLVFSTAYYGSPIPHAIQAKKKFPSIYRPYTGEDVNLIGRLPEAASGAADLWHTQAGALLLTGSSSREFATTTQKVRRWIMLLGLPLVIVSSIVRPRGHIVYLLYAPLFLLLYGWIGHTRPWYFPSFVTFAIVLLFAGWVRAYDLFVSAVKHRTGKWLSRWKVTQTMYILLFTVFLTVNNYAVNRGQYDHFHRGLFFPPSPWGALWDLWEAQRYHHYRNAAGYVNAQRSEPGVALISEVGVFGYFYAGDIIDTVGLCSPEALAFYPPPAWDIRDDEGHFYTKANNFTPTNMVMTLKPAFVVNSRFYMFNLLRAGSPFIDAYEEIHRFGRVWGEPVLIYRRLEARKRNDAVSYESEE